MIVSPKKQKRKGKNFKLGAILVKFNINCNQVWTSEPFEENVV